MIKFPGSSQVRGLEQTHFLICFPWWSHGCSELFLLVVILSCLHTLGTKGGSQPGLPMAFTNIASEIPACPPNIFSSWRCDWFVFFFFVFDISLDVFRAARSCFSEAFCHSLLVGFLCFVCIWFWVRWVFHCMHTHLALASLDMSRFGTTWTDFRSHVLSS